MRFFGIADPSWTCTRQHRQLRLVRLSLRSCLAFKEFEGMFSQGKLSSIGRIVDGFKGEIITEKVGDSMEDC
jgi:hypothetical protein